MYFFVSVTFTPGFKGSWVSLTHLKSDLSELTEYMVSAGLEVESIAPVPVKKPPSAPQLGDKYNIKPAMLKRPR